MSGMYQINKKDMVPKYFSHQSTLGWTNIRPDKYIRCIYKDNDGIIWAGGYYNLKSYNIQTKENTVTPDLNSNTVNKGRNVEIMNTTTDTTGTTTSTDNNTDNRTRDESLMHSNNNTTIYSTGDEIRKVLENTAIRNDWIHCFDNLFMEVL